MNFTHNGLRVSVISVSLLVAACGDNLPPPLPSGSGNGASSGTAVAGRDGSSGSGGSGSGSGGSAGLGGAAAGGVAGSAGADAVAGAPGGGAPGGNGGGGGTAGSGAVGGISSGGTTAGSAGTGGCQANALFCQGQELRRCTADGTASTVSVRCLTTQYCNAQQGACVAQLCSPNQPTCDGSVATSCNADGSGYMGTRIDCATSGLLCTKGSCIPPVCKPSALFCDGATIRKCSADGMSSIVSSTCLIDTYCDPSTATCLRQLCSPSQPACVNGLAGTCTANGSGLTTSGTNCAASSQVCYQGSCLSNVTETVGVPPASGTGSTSLVFLGNYYAVTTNRTLVLLEQYFAGGAPSNCTFRIYESTTQKGTYSLLATPVALTFSGGFIASNDISVKLVAGRFYLIGTWMGAATNGYSNDTGNPAVPVSFGTMFGAALLTNQSQPPASVVNSVYPTVSDHTYAVQRLHTTP